MRHGHWYQVADQNAYPEEEYRAGDWPTSIQCIERVTKRGLDPKGRPDRPISDQDRGRDRDDQQEREPLLLRGRQGFHSVGQNLIFP